MRTREEMQAHIVKQSIEQKNAVVPTLDMLILETLLDIRDLLQKPPIEISGKPLPTNHH